MIVGMQWIATFLSRYSRRGCTEGLSPVHLGLLLFVALLVG
jgi:hypothetical protein